VAEPKRKATYDDVLAAPEHQVAEILDGELFLSPRPTARHATATSALGGDLSSAFHRPKGDPPRPGGWWIIDEPELHFGADVVVPDIAGWQRDRMRRIPDAAWLELAPDWLCETLSPSTARIDRTRKLAIYAREGVRHVWLVDPLARTLEVLAACRPMGDRRDARRRRGRARRTVRCGRGRAGAPLDRLSARCGHS